MQHFQTMHKYTEYMNLPSSGHSQLYIGKYDDSPQLRLSSPPIQTDFYHISIKSNFRDRRFDWLDTRQVFVYITQPKQPMEWDTSEPWYGFQAILSKQLFEQNPHLSFSFLTYIVHEALFLNDQEEEKITQLFHQALCEYKQIDGSTDVIVAYCFLFMTYIEQFYKRQFETRKPVYNNLVKEFHEQLNAYYQQDTDEVVLPTVKFFANRLHVSTGYLSDILRHYTGRSAIDHIHDHIIDEAKVRLRQSNATIAEIAYQLGFDYPTYFSRIFKQRTAKTPSQYRKQ